MLIGTVKMKMNLMTKLEALDEIIEDLRDHIQPHDTGHIHTTINVLTHERNKLRDKIAEAIQR
jgi:uncharacterized protein YdcH (DUF465 family)